jgi:type IV pilus assembly protein PilC
MTLPLLQKKRMKSDVLSLFFRQMAAMLASGIGMETALGLLTDESGRGSMEELSHDIRRCIAGNGPDPGSRPTYPSWILGIFTAIFRKKTTGKEVSEILHSIADDFETMDNLRQRFAGLMAYPVTTLFTAATVTSVILVFVIPTFQELFNTMGSNLPEPTLFVLKLSVFFKHYGAFLVTAALVLIGLLVKSKQVRDSVPLLIPNLNRQIKSLSMIQFSRYLSVLLILDEPVEQAFETAAKAVSNTIHSKRLLAISSSATNRNNIPSLLEKTGLFPPMNLRMLTAGANSGTLETTLSELAKYYEKTVQANMTTLFVLLEIIIGMVLSISIGGLVIAMYLPIFKMGAAVGG